MEFIVDFLEFIWDVIVAVVTLSAFKYVVAFGVVGFFLVWGLTVLFRGR